MPPLKYKVLSWTSTQQEVKEAVEEYFGKPFAKIVECESNYKLHAKNVNKNKTIDGGFAQINSSNLAEAKKLGYDLSTVQGQFEYVEFLIKRRGFDDWTCKKVLKNYE